MVLHDGANDGASLRNLSSTSMTARVAIGVVDVDEPSSLTLAEGQELRTTKVASHLEVSSPRLKSQKIVT